MEFCLSRRDCKWHLSVPGSRQRCFGSREKSFGPEAPTKSDNPKDNRDRYLLNRSLLLVKAEIARASARYKYLVLTNHGHGIVLE